MKPGPAHSAPAPAAEFHILVSLAEGEKHGYAILKEVARRTDGQVKLRTATLYTVIKRFIEDELIVESAARPDPALDDERRKYYRLTDRGRKVAMAEAARMEQTLRAARVKLGAPDRPATDDIEDRPWAFTIERFVSSRVCCQPSFVATMAARWRRRSVPTADTLTLQVFLTGRDYGDNAAINRFYDALGDRIRSMPGVVSVSASTNLPLSGNVDRSGIATEGRPAADAASAPEADTYAVRDGYFRTMGIPLRRGRLFTAGDGTARRRS